MIARIKLYSWFGCRDLQPPATRRVGRHGGEFQVVALVVQHPVMVVTQPRLDLWMFVVDTLADFARRCEVERRPAHAHEFAGRYGLAVDRNNHFAWNR